MEWMATCRRAALPDAGFGSDPDAEARSTICSSLWDQYDLCDVGCQAPARRAARRGLRPGPRRGSGDRSKRGGTSIQLTHCDRRAAPGARQDHGTGDRCCATTSPGPSRARARTTPSLWTCGKPFRFPTSSTGGTAALQRIWTAGSVTLAGAGSGHRVAEKRGRSARRQPADR